MSIVAISRGSLYKGKEVAEKVAEVLGYKCLDRQFLIEASVRFNVPEAKLNKALENAPGFLDRLKFGRGEYIAYIRNALLERLVDDNTVYHGIAGHFFVKDLSHVLKIRIISNMENRVKEVAQRDEITEKDAFQAITKIDEARKRWSHYFYGVDIEDPGLYDLVINIDQLTAEEAADLITTAACLPRFQSTPAAQKQLEDHLLASRAHTFIMKSYPRASVVSKDGVVTVVNEGVLSQESEFNAKIKEALKDVPGIQQVLTKIWPIADPY